VYFTCTDKTILGGAFFIMDYSEGETLEIMNAPLDQAVDVFGKLHVRMHNIDPEPIIKRITEARVDIRLLKLEGWLEDFRTYVNMNFS